ncbi:MAG: TOMM precursor leader peptide-binding protein [Deltaproteobacteria bacterium]|nr:TOMM precursor leader peptide-binding protein [Deltaproteobacteria bacterium]
MGTVETPVAPCVRDGKVLVVGVGGLGSPAALALALAGVGTVGLIDPDTVDLSNLQRQILHHTPDLGRPKVESARDKLLRINPTVEVIAHYDRLHAENLSRLFRAYDFIIDATDGVAAKFLINDGAVLLGKPFSYGGIVQFVGQTLTVLPGQTTCLRCLFPVIPSADDIPTCQEAGIIGSVASSLGLVQATEAVKYLAGAHTLLTDRLLTYDALALRWRTVTVRRSPRCPLCGEAPTITSLQAEAQEHAESRAVGG